jgi:antitoxin component HigA of HigAB toxin-antitoxin module
MDKLEQIPVNSNYIEVINEIKNIISTVKFDNTSRDLLRDKIDGKLKDNYSRRKQSKEAPRQNIKLFDTHLVFVSDEIHDK